ncbi:S-adenosyl-L-methionine-dependent methyltransferase domain-containing protein [Capsicum annuum]|nr:S-adenosyl-L-methionine-dependent methyltransferase domain-containing protein [Capsicum annuum]KAF3663992.1 S-adenosyl-L-methionine-dependent methyltransferase domain-containing protein [Capsicum annuum]
MNRLRKNTDNTAFDKGYATSEFANLLNMIITISSCWCSGYGIAAQALIAVMRAHDGRGPQTMLSSCILQSLGLSSPDELIGWTYVDPSWARIAALVPVVVSCAEDGDDIADEILHNAVQELALSVRAVVQRLHLAGEGLTMIFGKTL